MGLTGKERLFAAEYLKDKNGKQAAIRAGYSPKTAEQQASRLLRKVKVRQAIEKHFSKVEEEAIVKVSDVLLELKRIALTDIGQAFDENGNLKPLKDIPEDVRRAIAGIDVDELYEGHGQDREQVGETKKIRFWDKNRALENLGRYFKLFTDRVEVVDGLAGRLAEARKRARAG
jgi:phage terminase small subunit